MTYVAYEGKTVDEKVDYTESCCSCINRVIGEWAGDIEMCPWGKSVSVVDFLIGLDQNCPKWEKR